MSTTTPTQQEASSEFLESQSEEDQYRSVSKAAVGCAVFAIFSLLAFLARPLLVFPLISIACGLIALSSFKRFPNELIGRKAVKFGFAIASLCFVGALTMYIVEHMTEVPPGYERISFRMLRDDAKTNLPYSEAAEELDGKKVFVRLYVRPGKEQKNLKEFIAVGNFGDCCYGGTEKITDVIGVRILTDETVDYSLRIRKVAGTFRLNRKSARTGDKDVPSVYYQIDADYIR